MIYSQFSSEKTLNLTIPEFGNAERIKEKILRENHEGVIVHIDNVDFPNNEGGQVSFLCDMISQKVRFSGVKYIFTPRELFRASLISVESSKLNIDLGFIRGTVRKDQISSGRIFFDSKEQKVLLNSEEILSVGSTLLVMVNSIREDGPNTSLVCSVHSMGS